MAELAAICLAAWDWVVDVQQAGRWFKPLKIFGMSAVAAYLISPPAANVLRVHFFGKSFYSDVCTHPASRRMRFCCSRSCVYSVFWFICRRRWFLKF